MEHHLDSLPPQFSDMLLYANRATQQGVQFKVHGQLAVTDLQVVDSEPRMGADFCFNIYDGKRALMVAAATLAEKTQWMEDITETVQVGTQPWLLLGRNLTRLSAGWLYAVKQM